jgi:hypothetical protein
MEMKGEKVGGQSFGKLKKKTRVCKASPTTEAQANSKGKKKNYSNQEATPFANTWGACNRFLVDQSNTLEKEGNEKILS